MSDRSATHATFVIDRNYDAAPARVFAAWADPKAKGRWFGPPGGQEPSSTSARAAASTSAAAGGGAVYSYDALYEDIVEDERIVYTYKMHRDDVRISVSVSTVELLADGRRDAPALHRAVRVPRRPGHAGGCASTGPGRCSTNSARRSRRGPRRHERGRRRAPARPQATPHEPERGAADGASERSRRMALYVLCVGMLMIVLDVTIVNVALPSIQEDLHFSTSSLAWVVNAYLIAFGGLLLLAGRLGDLIGRRRMFLAGIVLFTSASLLCGAAQAAWWLVAARFVQGVGGAMTSAVILGMIVTMFGDAREQAKAIGVFAFVASAGGSVGLLAGGVLTQSINWHWIFFVNLPIGIATALAARRLVPDEPGIGLDEGADVPGAVLITSALMLGVYTIVGPAAKHGWGSGSTLLFGAGSIALLVAFLARETRAASPLMPLRIFRSRPVAAANAIQILSVAGMFGMFFLGALYLRRVLGYDALEIGLAFLPVTIAMGTLSIRYSERIFMALGARRALLAGLTLRARGPRRVRARAGARRLCDAGRALDAAAGPRCGHRVPGADEPRDVGRDASRTPVWHRAS